MKIIVKQFLSFDHFPLFQVEKSHRSKYSNMGTYTKIHDETNSVVPMRIFLKWTCLLNFNRTPPSPIEQKPSREEVKNMDCMKSVSRNASV